MQGIPVNCLPQSVAWWRVELLLRTHLNGSGGCWYPMMAHSTQVSYRSFSSLFPEERIFLSNGGLCGSYIFNCHPHEHDVVFFIVMWRDWRLRSYRATHEIDFGHRLAIAASLYYSTTDGWGCCFQSDKMFTWPTEGCCGWTDWYRCPCLGSGKVDGLFFGYILLFATLYDSDLRGWNFFASAYVYEEAKINLLKFWTWSWVVMNYQSPLTLSHKGDIGPPNCVDYRT